MERNRKKGNRKKGNRKTTATSDAYEPTEHQLQEDLRAALQYAISSWKRPEDAGEKAASAWTDLERLSLWLAGLARAGRDNLSAAGEV